MAVFPAHLPVVFSILTHLLAKGYRFVLFLEAVCAELLGLENWFFRVEFGLVFELWEMGCEEEVFESFSWSSGSGLSLWSHLVASIQWMHCFLSLETILASSSRFSHCYRTCSAYLLTYWGMDAFLAQDPAILIVFWQCPVAHSPKVISSPTCNLVPLINHLLAVSIFLNLNSTTIACMTSVRVKVEDTEDLVVSRFIHPSWPLISKLDLF